MIKKMAKIIKNGKNYTDLGKIKCPRCDCIFIYNKKDIEIYDGPINFAELSAWYHYVSCPECKRRIIISGECNGISLTDKESILETY